MRLSMVPSGFEVSHSMLPWKPVTRAISAANSATVMSVPVPRPGLTVRGLLDGGEVELRPRDYLAPRVTVGTIRSVAF